MITYSLARAEDEAILRQLLRDNAMPSWVTMSLAREPDFFAASRHFGREQAITARDGDNGSKAVGMCTSAEHRVHLNGIETELGYLGALRVNQTYRHKLRVLQGGFAAVRALYPEDESFLWYTAVAEENTVARRLLEANLRGMPSYRLTNHLVSLALSSAQGRRRQLWRPAIADDLAALCCFYNEQAASVQFSPVLTPERARNTGADFYVLERDKTIMACMALWNQQSYKQVVANHYYWPLGTLLPLYNAYARLTRRMVLPPVGQPLDLSYLAFFATAPHMEHEWIALVEDALSLASTAAVTLALHEQHPSLERLRQRFKPVIYRSGIYSVNFGPPPLLDGRAAQPEVAVL